MNLIAAFGYVIGVLIFAYIIRKKRKSVAGKLGRELPRQDQNLEEEKQND